MSINSFLLSRIPSLSKPSDYIHWKRRVKAFLQCDDPKLIGLSDALAATPAKRHNEWLAKSINAKSTIILFLGTSALSLTHLLIDDDRKRAKYLWDELSKHYTTSSTQMVLNRKQKLESFFFDERKGSWDTHVSDFSAFVMNFVSLIKI